MPQLVRRLWLGLFFGAGLGLLWGPMLRTEPGAPRTIFSVLTGVLVGVLAAGLRLPGPAFVGGATLGLFTSVPYAVANHVYSSMVGGAIFGAVIAWAVNFRSEPTS